MRGLPYRVTVDTIQQFFDGHAKLTQDEIFIEEFNGKRTGSALVVFENEQVAQDAKASLNKNEVDGRYIELFDQNDNFMRKICKLD
jgi:RNA recognition motif-containing protein